MIEQNSHLKPERSYEVESEHFAYEYGKAVRELDKMLYQVPQEYWIT